MLVVLAALRVVVLILAGATAGLGLLLAEVMWRHNRKESRRHV